ncbi:hypothetical protein ERJ75_001786300 [Trypanosoma vivax]|nr:hypothetical protein ERJ75_001786300 [Trypanosoma vivax]
MKEDGRTNGASLARRSLQIHGIDLGAEGTGQCGAEPHQALGGHGLAVGPRGSGGREQHGFGLTRVRRRRSGAGLDNRVEAGGL